MTITDVTDGGLRHSRHMTLPEIWNSPYDTKAFPANAEPVPAVGVDGSDTAQLDPALSPSSAMICAEAKRHGVHLIGGSVPYEGRVEVSYNGVWGTVNADWAWGNSDDMTQTRDMTVVLTPTLGTEAPRRLVAPSA